MPLSDDEPAATREELHQLAAELDQHSSEMRSELTIELGELRHELSRLGLRLQREVRRSVEHATDLARADLDRAQSRQDAQVEEFTNHLRTIGSGLESRLNLAVTIAALVSVLTVIAAMVFLVGW